MDYRLPWELVAIRGAIYHFVVLIFWIAASTFLLYTHMQFWLLFYLSVWFLNTILYFFILYVWFLRPYEQPLRIIVIYLGLSIGVMYFMVHFGSYGIIDFADLYISFMAAFKQLEAFCSLVLDLVVISSFIKFRKYELLYNYFVLIC